MSNEDKCSSEFNVLCQSQIAILCQSLGAMWSVVYLTEGISENGQGQLFPVAIYPSVSPSELLALPTIKTSDIWQIFQAHSSKQLLPNYLTSSNKLILPDGWNERESAQSKQLILPLVYQEMFIGLLVAGRDDREWQSSELKQIEEITRTIAIARYLELQHQWTQQELVVQENLRRIEHERLDNLFHQLRNPLTALRTFGKLLLKRMVSDDPNRKLAASILTQSDRFQSLLEQFEAESTALPGIGNNHEDEMIPMLTEQGSNLDQSSFLLPSAQDEFMVVDLTKILAPLGDTAQALASEKDIKLSSSIPAHIPNVRGNPQAIEEILNNLLDNALKYTPAGGQVVLELVTANASNLLGIAFKDSGLGIPPQDQERIFARHYRGVQAQGNIPGTGLGLAIAQELAVKMGGQIEIISPNHLQESSLGSTFIFWLPVANLS